MAVKGRNSHNLLFGAKGPFIYVNSRQILMTYQYYNFLSDQLTILGGNSELDIEETICN